LSKQTIFCPRSVLALAEGYITSIWGFDDLSASAYSAYLQYRLALSFFFGASYDKKAELVPALGFYKFKISNFFIRLILLKTILKI
jgi:hypothetical protein